MDDDDDDDIFDFHDGNKEKDDYQILPDLKY